ncbi:MAG: hypothetical protein K0Q81_1259 [Paenibacillus sp.]|nr:hypothetical protein [Paenibacillus sp.]
MRLAVAEAQLEWLGWISYGSLFVMVFISMYYALLSGYRKRGRWPVLNWNKWMKQQRYPAWWLKVLGIQLGTPGLEQKKQLLVRSGFQVDLIDYEVIRRLLSFLAVVVVLLGTTAARLQGMDRYIEPVYLLLCGGIMLLLLGTDRVILKAISKQRSQQIMKEIYVLSNQLLYYNGSRQSLHHKLSRCIPFTRVVRGELQLLLNEWYSGAEQSIRRFKQRLSTDEAYSFAETINSIRLYENDNYYALLRERIQDYKEKLGLAKDSRKETTSYVLFLIAGLPILNTFRIFIYPWVMEGQKLFQTLQ